MHIESHIDTVFAWRPLPLVEGDNKSTINRHPVGEGKWAFGRKVWRNRISWIDDDGRAICTDTYYKDLTDDPRIPGSAKVVSCRPMHPGITLGEDNSWTSWT